MSLHSAYTHTWMELYTEQCAYNIHPMCNQAREICSERVGFEVCTFRRACVRNPLNASIWIYLREKKKTADHVSLFETLVYGLWSVNALVSAVIMLNIYDLSRAFTREPHQTFAIRRVNVYILYCTLRIYEIIIFQPVNKSRCPNTISAYNHLYSVKSLFIIEL